MQAKDIVAEEVARQADFGYEPSWEDFVIAGQKAGRKEVGEWINAHGKDSRIKLITDFIPISVIDWQAKLEEWGVANA